jgi:hypothetical protein
MSVSEPFIRRPVGTSLLAVGILVLGAVAYHFQASPHSPVATFGMLGYRMKPEANQALALLSSLQKGVWSHRKSKVSCNAPDSVVESRVPNLKI